MSSLFFRNPRLTVLAIGLVLVAGFAAFDTLPRQEDPTLARRFGSVTTYYPGASAERVEALVTEKLEDHLLELHEIDVIDSISRAGVSLISINLQDRYSEEDVDEIWSKVRDKLADAEALLPAGAGTPEFEDRGSTAVTMLVALSWEQDDEPQLALMTRIASELEARLRNLPNTRETRLYGEAEEEVRVTVDPLTLASVDLTATEVAAMIARADAKVPAGQLRHRANDLLIEVAGEIETIERIRDVPLRREADGSFLRLGEIARVEKTVREPAATAAIVGGRAAVVVAATMQPGGRVDRWAERARAVVEEFRVEVPTGIRYELLFDQSVYTGERLGNLVGNLIIGALIVVGVLLVMMGLRAALVVAAALPLTIAMVLAELNFFGVPLHQTSITGLIIALGLLIDNAIVVVDDFDRLRREGAAAVDAVNRVVRKLAVPLAASTFTTVLAFLPIVLMPGGAGEFVGPISIGVGLSVISSYALAMTVIPALAGFIVKPYPDGRPAWWRDGWSHPRLTEVFRRTLHLTLRVPALGVAVSIVLPILGFAVGQTLSQQFFPANDRNQFQVQLVLPSQTSLAATREQAMRARALIESHPEVLDSAWFVGEAPPRVFYNMFGNQDGVSSFAGAFVTTESPEATERLLPRLQAELIEAFPNARAIALPFEQGPPFDAPIELRLIGPDLEVLRGLGEELRGALARTNRVTYTTAKLAGGSPKLLIRADEDEAGLVGLSLVDIARQLDARLEGVLGGSLIEGTEELPVRVRVSNDDRDTPSRIASGRILAPARAARTDDRELSGVPLASLAELRLVPELSGITRRNGARSNTIQAFLEPYAVIADALADFEQQLAHSGFTLPPGYELQQGGEDEQRSDAMSKLMAYALPLFVLMAGSIVLSFNSFRRAGVIFVVAFLGVGLAQLGIWVFGYPMGFVGIVGTMGLVGLAINDAIVVLTALRSDSRARNAEVGPTAQVVIDATRHVLATTLTTIGGFLPLIVAGGRFWPPMATAIVGGVIGCSILALYLVPSAYVAIRRREMRRAESRAVGTPQPVAIPA